MVKDKIPASQDPLIRIKRGTKKKLDEKGNKGDTYDDVVNSLFNMLEHPIRPTKKKEKKK